MPILKKLKQLYKIEKVIIVADRGIGSSANLQALTSHGFDYIVGAKLRTASKSIQAQAIANDGFTALYHGSNNDNCRYKIIDNKEQSWVVLHSAKRASKDKYDRDILVARAQEMLQKSAINCKRGARKFIKSDKVKSILDIDKINNEALYDGYYALSFSDKTMNADAIADSYHKLWMIEESFRTMKSFFEIRPMFHWTTSRIKGHIMLNFLALVLHNNLLLDLKKKLKDVSHEILRNAIEHMQRSTLDINSCTFYSYPRLSHVQKSIINLLGITYELKQTL